MLLLLLLICFQQLPRPEPAPPAPAAAAVAQVLVDVALWDTHTALPALINMGISLQAAAAAKVGALAGNRRQGGRVAAMGLAACACDCGCLVAVRRLHTCSEVLGLRRKQKCDSNYTRTRITLSGLLVAFLNSTSSSSGMITCSSSSSRKAQWLPLLLAARTQAMTQRRAPPTCTSAGGRAAAPGGLLRDSCSSCRSPCALYTRQRANSNRARPHRSSGFGLAPLLLLGGCRRINGCYCGPRGSFVLLPCVLLVLLWAQTAIHCAV